MESAISIARDTVARLPVSSLTFIDLEEGKEITSELNLLFSYK